MKKIILVLCIALILSVSALASKTVKISDVAFDKVYPTYSDVVVVEKDGLTGVVDRSGSVIVPFGTYSVSLPDRLGRVAVYENGKSTVYDKIGKKIKVIENQIVTSTADGIALGHSDASILEGMTVLSSVTYTDITTGRVVYTSDNVVDATPFSDGYASVRKLSRAVVIDTSGTEVFYADAPLELLGSPADGIAAFEMQDENGDFYYFVADIKAKKLICLSGEYDFTIDTNFETSVKGIENIVGIFLFTDNDNRRVPVLDGVFTPIIEHPIYIYKSNIIIRNGENIGTVGRITSFAPGGKYFFRDEDGVTFYYGLNANAVMSEYEGVTGFSKDYCVVYGTVDEDAYDYVFVDNDLKKTDMGLSGFSEVRLYGDLFGARKADKWHLVKIAEETAPSKPPVVPVVPKPVDNSGMKNFVKAAVYNSKVFPDVKENDWFVKNVALAYETGLMNGKGDGFAPMDNLTVAQVITMAARLNSIYETGKAEFVQGSVWYQVYVDFCVKKGIIGSDDFTDYNRNTTRAEFVRILSRAIPEKEFDLKNSVSGVPDVALADKDYKSVLMFYRAGILSGSDSAHNFKPTSNITRAETAAIITRIIDKTLRVGFEIK